MAGDGTAAISAPIDRRATVRTVLRLAWPAIAQQLLHTLVFLADRAMLGRHSASALASMQINGPLVWSLFTVLSAFAVGTVALVGRAVGARDRRLASAATRASLLFIAAIGIAAAGLCAVSLDLYLRLFPDAGDGVQTAARGYLRIVLPMVPLYLLSFTGGAAMQAAGDTRTPFIVAAAGNSLNVGLNYILIFGHLGAPALGVEGAAAASGSAMTLQGVVLVALLARRRGPVTWRGRGGELSALRRMIRVSIASLAERFAQQVGYVAYATMIGALGSMAMAAHQGLLSIEAIAFLSADGFGIAAAAVVAQRLGAGSPREASLGARVATGLAVGTLGSCGIVFLFVPEILLSAFTNDHAIIALGVPCLYVAAAAQPFMATAVVLSEGLRGAGATRVAFAVTLLGGVFVRLGATALFAFALDLGLVGVWLGSTLDWAVRAALLAIAFARGRWRDITV